MYIHVHIYVSLISSCENLTLKIVDEEQRYSRTLSSPVYVELRKMLQSFRHALIKYRLCHFNNNGNNNGVIAR